jgi:transcriptional regulator GlxA family with amidase domain
MAAAAESARTTIRTGILLFDGFEVLDAFGPGEAFGSARFPAAPGGPADAPAPFALSWLAPGGRPVRAGNGGTVQVVPDFALEDAPPLDLLLIPGGLGTRTLVSDAAFIESVRRLAARTPLVVSVCTGAALLARAGLLNGRPATTNHLAFDWVRTQGPTPPDAAPIAWTREPRWVDDGDIVTSAGVSAGIDMALHLVQRLHGEAVARATASGMEYDWRRDGESD